MAYIKDREVNYLKKYFLDRQLGKKKSSGNGMSMKKKIGIGIVVLIVIIGVAAAFTGNGNGGEDTETPSGSEETGPSADDVEILEHELVREDEGTSYETVSVEGQAKNVSGKELSYVEIKVVYYDEEGMRIDDSLTNTTDLPNQEVWAFEVGSVLMGEEATEVTDYEISVESADW